MDDLYETVNRPLTLADDDEGIMPVFDEQLFEDAAKEILGQGGYNPDFLATPEGSALIGETHRILMDGVNRSLTEETDPAVKAALEQNVFTFSGFKTHQELKEVSEHLTTPEGGIKPWNEFRQEILSINKDYNENYLQAEYNHAVASAQMASKMGASEQSPAMPDPKNPTVSDSKNAIKVGEAATAKPKQQMFRCNPGLDLEVFPRKHPYLPKGCGACKKNLGKITLSYDPNSEKEH